MEVGRSITIKDQRLFLEVAWDECDAFMTWTMANEINYAHIEIGDLITITVAHDSSFAFMK
jgi:hypothetical protein